MNDVYQHQKSRRTRWLGPKFVVVCSTKIADDRSHVRRFPSLTLETRGGGLAFLRNILVSTSTTKKQYQRSNMVRHALLLVSAFESDSDVGVSQDEPLLAELSSSSTTTLVCDETASEGERLRLEGSAKSGEIIGRPEDGMKSLNSHTGLDWYPSPR